VESIKTVCSFGFGCRTAAVCVEDSEWSHDIMICRIEVLPDSALELSKVYRYRSDAIAFPACDRSI
jgi:hypothetical protein